MKLLKKILNKKDNKGSDAGIVRILCYLIFGATFFTCVDGIVLLHNMTMLTFHSMYCAKQLSVTGGLDGDSNGSTGYCYQKFYQASTKCGLAPDEITATVYSSGLSGGEAQVYPSCSYVEDIGRMPEAPVGSYYTISRGYNGPQNLEVIFIHTWKFSPFFRALGLETPITLNFNYRSEFIR